ncbi:rod shape-determining protein [candidate division KSB1 bacterium]|nr:rod shape-determining protein [candidate division KSB1 bacterium]
MTKIAAIDIGTNTALLLVAEVTKQNEIIPIAQEEKIVRLGQGVDRNEYLNSEAIGRTLRAIREQVKIAEDLGAEKILISGTSAVRDAANREILLSEIKNNFGITMQVLSGDEEAELTYFGALSNKNLQGDILLVDIGGGTTEIAIISLNGVVYSQSIRVGGDRFDESITAYVRRTQGSLIGDATAEKIKQEIGTAFPCDEVREIDVRGRNLAEGVPRSFTLNSNEILEALQEPLSVIVQAVKGALEQTPPELASDIAESGLVLTGGGSLLREIDRLLSHETGLPVIVAEDPLTCVCRGGGKALEIMDDRGDSDLLSIQ